MASKKVFDLMESEDWNEVTELLTNTTWTSQDLEEKHGVRSSSQQQLQLQQLQQYQQYQWYRELLLRLIISWHEINLIQYNLIVLEKICNLGLFLFISILLYITYSYRVCLFLSRVVFGLYSFAMLNKFNGNKSIIKFFLV